MLLLGGELFTIHGAFLVTKQRSCSFLELSLMLAWCSASPPTSYLQQVALNSLLKSHRQTHTHTHTSKLDGTAVKHPHPTRRELCGGLLKRMLEELKKLIALWWKNGDGPPAHQEPKTFPLWLASILTRKSRKNFPTSWPYLVWVMEPVWWLRTGKGRAVLVYPEQSSAF